MEITRETLCPLCKSKMTDYHYSHSDGEYDRLALTANDCTNRECRLPVRLWAKIYDLIDKISN